MNKHIEKAIQEVIKDIKKVKPREIKFEKQLSGETKGEIIFEKEEKVESIEEIIFSILPEPLSEISPFAEIKIKKGDFK